MIVEQKVTIYGLGGRCEECNSSHEHPLHNLIDERVEQIEIEPPIDEKVTPIAEALLQLPSEALNSIKEALGIL